MTSLAIWFSIILVLAISLLLYPMLTSKTSASKTPTDQAESDNPEKTLSQNRLGIYAVALFVPVFSMGFYFWIGTPQFAEIENSNKAPEVVTLVDKLEDKLARNPDDLQGWLLLGRSFMISEEYPKAINAFEKALKLSPNNINALVPLADALAVQAQGNLLGRPYELLQQAFQQQPENRMTLWLLGMAERQQNNPQAAEQHWMTLYNSLPADDADRGVIAKLLASINVQVPTAPSQNNAPSAASNNLTDSNESRSASKNHQLDEQLSNKVTVKLQIAPEILQQNPRATLFVYVKQIGGMPMPIAAKQFPLSQLKNQFVTVLSEQDTILANRQINQFPQFIVGYRIADAASVDQGKILYKENQQISNNQTAEFIIKY